MPPQYNDHWPRAQTLPRAARPAAGARAGIGRGARRGLSPCAAGWACLLACALVLAPRPGLGAGAVPCREATLQRVQQVYQQMRSFQGRFEQEDRRTDGELHRATGQIAYLRPGRMRWAYDPPNEQLLVTDGKTVWLYDPLLENVTVQPLGDMTRGTPLAFLLGVGNLSRDFACRPVTRAPPQDNLSYIELTPVEPIPALSFIQLGLTADTQRIAALVMVDPQGNTRRVGLLDLKLNPPLAKDLFTFQIAEGMEVIKN